MNFNKSTISKIGVLLIVVMVITTFAMPDDTYAAKKKKVKKITFTNAPNAVKVIKKGKKVKLKVKVYPKKASKKMKYKSSNKKVATVSSKGTIKAKKKGTAYITAYAKDGSKKKKRIKVIVGKPVTKINMSGESVIMSANADRFKATVSPKSASYKKLTWKSSNTKIATVSSKGYVKFKGNGTATITAYARDGSKVKGSMKVRMDTLRKGEASFIAHRGYSSKAPENSIDAFQRAASAGFGGIECDIWEVPLKVEEPPVDPPEETTDGAIEPLDEDPSPAAIETNFVVFHDSSLSRMTGVSGYMTDKDDKDINFEDLTNIRLRGSSQTIPSLEEYLTLMANYQHIQPVIEIKSYSGDNLISEEGTRKVIKMLRDRGLVNNALIISFGEDALIRFKEVGKDMGYHIKTSFLSNKSGQALLDDIDFAYENKMDAVSLNHRSITRSVVEYAHARGLDVGAYTLTSQLQAYNMISLMGVDNVSSDYKLWR